MSEVTVKSPDEPATERQVNYIRVLLDRRVIDEKWRARMVADLARGITKGAAHRMIDWLLNQPVNQNHEDAQKVQAGNSAPAYPVMRKRVTVPSFPIPDEGFYSIGSDIFAVVWNRQKTRRYGKKLVDVGGTWKWIADRSVLKAVHEHGKRLTASQASAFGIRTGTCAICARTLTDPESIARGIGPVCVSRVTV